MSNASAQRIERPATTEDDIKVSFEFFPPGSDAMAIPTGPVAKAARRRRC